MKVTRYFLLFLMAALWSCGSDDDGNATAQARQILNVSYGADPQQTYDVYLPAGRNGDTKVMLLIHGGGWSSGSKEDMNAGVQIIKTLYPQYAIVNMNYRLATQTSPAYPKQTDDIASVLAHISAQDYAISDDYAFLGVSAGGHLSMLYAYRFDTQHKVKAVCNIVGPTDFNDPAYAENELALAMAAALGGNTSESFLAEVSPVTHVHTQSAPTIQFMGNADPLIPITQGQRLKTALDNASVANELNLYNAGHGDFSIADTQDIYAKLGVFLNAHF